MRDIGQKLSDIERKLDTAQENGAVLSAPERRAQLGIAHDQKISEISIRKVRTAKEQKLVFEVATTVERSIADDNQTSSPIIEDVPRSQRVSNILKLCETLDRFITDQCGEGFVEECVPSFATEAVMHALQQWSTASTSQLLWLAGPNDYTVPSNVSAAVRAVVVSAQTLGVPQISHICERGTQPELGGQSAEESGLIGLLYSFIKQMLIQAPLRAKKDPSVSYDQISELDGTSVVNDE
ncbi:hypothetical protein AOQ84DRAFT_378547 [Glonium stellatum]|uniref:Uncharacterized protein n=1 Tax=Glonium stellatum TaxID=574774 RepID=A0A8E2EX36_9PEZI|nr:hypothetical protein AOQ84DRAFT_378547 [Glonium stellatum]